MIKSIFYSKFDVHEGPKVVHQVPNNSITSGSDKKLKPLVHFPSISSAIIPRQDFCFIPLTLLSYPYRVVTYPVCLVSSSYPRNEFIFSFSLLLHHETSTTAYASVVAKLAGLFKHLEESTAFLSKDPSPPNVGKVYAICEILLEDLNNYCEAMIPIDESNTLNIKLFPSYCPPPSLSPHYVPSATVRLSALIDANWDLTMIRILPFIDGVNSIRGIARLAKAEYKLVRKAIAHLVYYGCVTLLDVFNFNASYAPSANMNTFIEDVEMQEEALNYIISVNQQGYSNGASEISGARLDRRALVELYCLLKQGFSVKSWCIEHADIIGTMDVRRFITFGVIKGFLYRIHKHAVLASPSAIIQRNNDFSITFKAKRPEGNRHCAVLDRFLDGTHCFDEICTELMISEKELMKRLKGLKDVQIISK